MHKTMSEKSLQGGQRLGVMRQGGESLMTLEDLSRIVRRRKKGIMVAVAVSFSLAFGYHFLRIPEYHAVSIIMINDKNSKNQNDLFSKVVGPESGMVETNMSVLKDAELLKSMAVSEMAVKELVKSGRSNSMELFHQRNYYQSLVMAIKPVIPLFAGNGNGGKWYSDVELRRLALRLNRRIRVQPVKETNLIKISVASPYPDEAANLTSTICQVYRGIDITQNSEKYAQANRFISVMLQQQGQKLADADAALSRYMSAHEIYEETGNTDEMLKKLVEVDSHYNDLRAEYNIARNNLSFLNSKLSEADKELSSRISQNVTAQLGSIMDEVRCNESDYVKLVQEKGINAPESIAKKQQLDLVKSRYDQLSRSKIAGQIGYIGRAQKYSFDLVSEKLQIERKLNDLNFSANEFGRVKAHYETQLARLPVKQQEYIRLLRDRDAISKTYVFLKEKLDESRILIGSEVGSVSIIGDAFQPIKPESPSPKQTALLGVLLSGLIAGLYTFGAEKLDKTVKDFSFFRKNGLQRLFPIPFVSSSESNVAQVPMIVDMASSTFAESIRMVRAHLERQMAGTIVVSGTADGDGASAICANLGMAQAKTGRKTLIVDCNLQHAAQHEIFNLMRETGLGDILLGRRPVTDKDVVQATRVENLHLLAAGSPVENAGEFLASQRMAALVDELSSRYDMVLFDCPPLNLSDSASLSGLVNGILLVSRLGHAPEQAVSSLATDDFYASRILGVAVIDPSS